MNYLRANHNPMRFFIVFLLSASLLRAQSHYTEFYPTSAEVKPQWVQLLHSQEPNYYEVVAAYQEYYLEHAFEKNADTHFFKHLSIKS